jgi:hypothetical protein
MGSIYLGDEANMQPNISLLIANITYPGPRWIASAHN